MKRIPLSVRLLIGLALGLLTGLVIAASDSPALRALPAYVEPIGTIWANAIRMTVIPLVVSLLITAIAADRKTGAVAKLGGRAVGLMLVMAAATATFAALVGPPLMSLLRIDPAAAESMRAGAQVSTVALPPFKNWLIDLIPTNPIKAAADGALLPLIVFTAAIALALGRAALPQRDAVLHVFEAIKEAMFVLIGWILAVGPIGVFALVLALTVRLGASAAGAVGYFVLVACTLITVSLAALYPFVAAMSHVTMRQFMRAAAPAQVVAFTTRSSLASLPALVAGAQRMGVSPAAAGLVLPLGVSIFKYASPIVRIVGTLLVAKLYGIELGAAQIASVAAAIGLLSFYSPGIPSGGLFVMTPVYMALGLPVEGIGILIALDVIPDMFLSATNATADLAVATVLARGAAEHPTTTTITTTTTTTV